MRVLIVHENAAEAEALVATMESQGHEVVGVVGSAQDAAEAVRTTAPELLLVRLSAAMRAAQPALLSLAAKNMNPSPPPPTDSSTSRSGTFRLGETALSTREREVFNLLVQGHRVAEIGRRLFISPHTVRKHTKSIFRKLDVHSQVELMGRYRPRRATPATF